MNQRESEEIAVISAQEDIVENTDQAILDVE